MPAAGLPLVEAAVGIAGPAQPQPPVGRKPCMLLVIEAAQRELFEVVLALQLPRRLPCRLHRRQQQRNQNADDRNHDQKLHERKAVGILDGGWWMWMGIIASSLSGFWQKHAQTGGNMDREQLRNRMKQFALRIINSSSRYPQPGRRCHGPADSPLRHVHRANYSEAVRASSRKHFISIVEIAAREAGETLYWLELLAESKTIRPTLIWRRSSKSATN